MIHRQLYIGSWICDFFFALDSLERGRILHLLYDYGASDDMLDRADMIMDGGYNKGFTYTNPRLKHSIVVIGPTSNGAEFLDSFVHEVRHLANDIAEELGYDLDAEMPAYLSGDAARALAEDVCRLGCR